MARAMKATVWPWPTSHPHPTPRNNKILLTVRNSQRAWARGGIPALHSPRRNAHSLPAAIPAAACRPNCESGGAGRVEERVRLNTLLPRTMAGMRDRSWCRPVSLSLSRWDRSRDPLLWPFRFRLCVKSQAASLSFAGSSFLLACACLSFLPSVFSFFCAAAALILQSLGRD